MLIVRRLRRRFILILICGALVGWCGCELWHLFQDWEIRRQLYRPSATSYKGGELNCFCFGCGVVAGSGFTLPTFIIEAEKGGDSVVFSNVDVCNVGSGYQRERVY